MKSPFPGMDPYIELCGLWEDFHHLLIAKIGEAIADVLPRGYTVTTAVRSYIVLAEPEGKDESLAKPDVTITHPKSSKTSRQRGGTAVAEPEGDTESVPMQSYVAEEFKESFIEIYARREERILITCLEVLSPSNKRRGTEGWFQYERKRQALLLGKANFIEIDLLRGGDKMPMQTPWPDCPYTLLVSPAYRAPYCRVWKGHFQRRLPPIPVPLLRPDPNLTLDLQPLIDGIYDRFRYEEQIDYTQSLTRPWSAHRGRRRAPLTEIPPLLMDGL